MTHVDADASPGITPPQPSRRFRRRWLLAAAASLLVAAALALGLGLRWLYSPHDLVPPGAYTVIMNRPAVVTVYSPGMVDPSSEAPITVDVRSVTPRVATNTADATITALICHRNGTTTPTGSDDLSMCTWTKPFKPGVLTLDGDLPGTDSVIFKVSSRHAGRVTIDGVHVSYRRGLRHGSQDTGPTFVLKAARSGSSQK